MKPSETSANDAAAAPDAMEASEARPAERMRPFEEAWADALEIAEEDLIPAPKVPRGQVRFITHEVEQDASDPSLFQVSGKDRSWFLQKGALSFEPPSPSRWRLQFSFQGGSLNRFGDDYAELSRADQLATINWLLMVGAVPEDYALTGFKDCKAGGFYFLFHLSYRRTAWRIIGCPHYNCEVEDAEGKLFTSDPQEGDQFEMPAFEGQTLTVEYSDRELWILDGDRRVVRGSWVHEGKDTEDGKLPNDVSFLPAVLTPNCPTRLQVCVS